MSDEKYVRAHWADPSKSLANFNRNLYPAFMDDWAAAAEFTRERLEQIRQLEADLKWVKDARVIQNIRDYDTDAKRRTIARLESALSDLKRGMR